MILHSQNELLHWPNKVISGFTQLRKLTFHIFCYLKEARPQRLHIILFQYIWHSGKGKTTEMEDWTVVSRSCHGHDWVKGNPTWQFSDDGTLLCYTSVLDIGFWAFSKPVEQYNTKNTFYANYEKNQTRYQFKYGI